MALDLINQQEDLRGSFNGTVSVKVLEELFIDKRDIDGFPTSNRNWNAAAKWERQVHTSAKFPIIHFQSPFLQLNSELVGREGGRRRRPALL
jgi:hypothetical protein